MGSGGAGCRGAGGGGVQLRSVAKVRHGTHSAVSYSPLVLCLADSDKRIAGSGDSSAVQRRIRVRV